MLFERNCFLPDLLVHYKAAALLFESFDITEELVVCSTEAAFVCISVAMATASQTLGQKVHHLLKAANAVAGVWVGTFRIWNSALRQQADHMSAKASFRCRGQRWVTGIALPPELLLPPANVCLIWPAWRGLWGSETRNPTNKWNLKENIVSNAEMNQITSARWSIKRLLRFSQRPEATFFTAGEVDWACRPHCGGGPKIAARPCVSVCFRKDKTRNFLSEKLWLD